MEEKLRCPRIGGAYGIGDEDIIWVTALLRTQADVTFVGPECLPGAMADPEDDYVLATGVLGHADCLVTGDRGLLALEEHQGMRPLTPTARLALLG